MEELEKASYREREKGKTKCRFQDIASRQDGVFVSKSWHAGTHCQTWLKNKRAAGKQICVWWARWSAVPLPSTHTQQHTRRTPQTGKHIVPTTCGLRPFPRSPRHWRKSCGCNEISYRFFNETQYYILSGPRFFPFTLAQHKYAQRKESIQTRKKVKHPAIYQLWISKSGPVSPDCWDFAIYESTFIYLFIM